MKKNSDIDLLDLATIFAQRKSTLVWTLLIATFIGLIIALIWPKSYKSELTYIVTDSNSINFSSGGLLSGIANLSVGGSNITADQTLVILRSTGIKDKIIEKFNLFEVYGRDVSEHVREELDNSVEIEEVREGGIGFNSIIAVNFSVMDEKPQRAYDMIRFYYHQLDSTVQLLNKKNIEGGYTMLKNRLAQNSQDLEEAEDSLVQFQQKYGILEVEEQAKALIENIADVKSEIVQLEVQIGYVEEVFGKNSSKLNELQLRKQEFEKKYKEMMVAESDAEAEFDIYKSMSEMPDLFLQYLRLYREVEVQQEIYKVLYPQFEQQKLNYEEINSGLRLIDSANLPTYKDSPKRAYIVIAFFLTGLIFSVLLILFREWEDKIRTQDPEEYNRYQSFIRALKFRNDKN